MKHEGRFLLAPAARAHRRRRLQLPRYYRCLRSCGAVEIAPEKCDVALYHVGNNTLHRDIYQRALTHPGVVVLHDAVLQHLLLGMLDQNEYVEEFVYNYGEESRATWAASCGSSEPDPAPTCATSRVPCSSASPRPRARSSCTIPPRRHWSANMPRDAQIFEIPHLFQQPALPSPEETLRFRESLGLTPETLLIGTFGHQRETKRLAVVLRAFQRANTRCSPLGFRRVRFEHV